MKKALLIAATLLTTHMAQASNSAPLYKCNLMVRGEKYKLTYTADLADKSIPGGTFYNITPNTPLDLGEIMISEIGSSWGVDIQRLDGKKGPGSMTNGSELLLSAGGSDMVLVSCKKLSK
ncbi:hypothetical protein DOM22_15475 [Bdellovibrio sp. ZAP7]|uniref:hypothetical protein n=1 Tax=Bdellovibrio sp. ZAP7 TaxID=2231053 RepID=UPI0011576E92|nr:hypothetical protein [Bdellovibrio sp. ZAP7]QDK46464.1 hypothetical protein DOM22_15475 [Bdellovibrio sp. ZAP7]